MIHFSLERRGAGALDQFGPSGDGAYEKLDQEPSTYDEFGEDVQTVQQDEPQPLPMPSYKQVLPNLLTINLEATADTIERF